MICVVLEAVDHLYPRAGAEHWEKGFLPELVRFLEKRNNTDGSHRQDAQDWKIVEVLWIVKGREGCCYGGVTWEGDVNGGVGRCDSQFQRFCQEGGRELISLKRKAPMGFVPSSCPLFATILLS